MRTLPLLENRKSGGDKVKDFLGEGDDKAACESEKPLGALAGVMGLEREAHLDNAPAQENEANGPDKGEDERGEIAHNSQRVVCRQSCSRKNCDYS